MSAILLKVRNINPLTPKSFAAALGDFDFDGTATAAEMRAFWQLAHDCIDAAPEKSLHRRTAMFAMSGFLMIESAAAFPKLNVKIVTYQMVLRLLKPERVNQRVFGICGPAHFILLLIKSRPIKYVSMAFDLLTKGKTMGEDGFEIIPDKYVLDFEPGESIPEADWLLAAPLRNAQTPIPPGKERGVYGGTNGPEVFAYFQHAGYERIVLLSCYQRSTDWLGHALKPGHYEQFEPSELRKMVEGFAAGDKMSDPIVNFRIACKLREIGWRVMLQTNAELIKFDPITDKEREAAKTGKTFDVKRLADKEEAWKGIVTEKTMSPGIYTQNVGHWVLAKEIAIKGDAVKMTVYTWGTQHSVKAQITLKEFSNCYGGFVAAFA